MIKDILTQFSFENAQGYPHAGFFWKCSRVSARSVLFKMLKGILTQVSFQNDQGYPHTVFLWKCTRVSSCSFDFEMLKGIRTHCSFQNAQGYPYTGCLTEHCEKQNSLREYSWSYGKTKIYFQILMTLFLECIRCILTQFAFIIFGVDAGIIVSF